MNIIVKKFGGTSVGSIERIKEVAKRIIEDYHNNKIVVVVSAMANSTDKLNKLAHQICDYPCKRELDMLLTAGERISMSLLSIALQNLGYNSISFTGSQSGVVTDFNHGNARIKKVTAFRIREELKKNKIVIVAGFQGVSEEKEITTLGRGGSDTTAVALSCYLDADKCEIFTDVDSVMTADPRIVENSLSIKNISYDLMIAFAKSGSKVIHKRALEFAKKYNKKIELKSSFNKKEGSLIGSSNINETVGVVGISHFFSLSKYVINTEELSLEKIYDWLSSSGVDVYYNLFKVNYLYLYLENKFDIEVKDYLKNNRINFSFSSGISCVDLIGVKISSDFDFLSKLTKLLKEKKCNLDSLIQDDLKVKMFISNNEDDVKEIIKYLHFIFVESGK